MKIISASRPRLIPALLSGLVTITLSACTVVPRQSGLASTADNVSASNKEILIQLYGNAFGFSSAVQQAADVVLAEAVEPEIRRKALEFKINAISASQVTTAYADPLMGLLDLWALSVQLRNYYTTGGGMNDFGQYQTRVTSRLAGIPPAMEERAANLLKDNNITRGAQLVNDWADAHPFRTGITDRPWMIDTLMTFMDPGGVGAAGAMGEMASELGNISARLSIYYSQLPSQMRWEGQLFLEDILKENYDLRQSVDSIVSMSASLGRVVEIAESGSPLVDDLLTIVRADIRSLMMEAFDSVDVIRVETMADVDRELAIALAAVQYERIAIMATIDTMTQARINQTVSSVRRLMWLGLLLAAVMLAGPFVLGYIVARAIHRSNSSVAAA